MSETAPQETDPIIAFEAARRELSLLRHALEGLTAAREKIPDYGQTLAQMKSVLGVHAQKLDAIQSSPAMELTPEAMADRINASAHIVRAQDRKMLGEVQDKLSQMVGRMDEMVVRKRSGIEQQRQLLWFSLGGLFFGILLWSILPGAIARSLPVSWHVPEWMASRMMGMEQKEAGRRMILSAREDEKKQ